MNGSQGRQLIYLLLTISGTVLTNGPTGNSFKKTAALPWASSLPKPEPQPPGNP